MSLPSSSFFLNRKLSLITRFNRLRSTDLGMCFFGTAKPSRACLLPLSLAINKSDLSLDRDREENTSLNSSGFVSLFPVRKRFPKEFTLYNKTMLKAFFCLYCGVLLLLFFLIDSAYVHESRGFFCVLNYLVGTFFSYAIAFVYFTALKRAHMLLLQLQISQLQPANITKIVLVDNYFDRVYTLSFSSLSEFQRGFISGYFPMEALPGAA